MRTAVRGGERMAVPSRPSPPPSGPSLEACAGAVVGVTVAYIGAEAALAGPLHPVHWGLALLGGAIGYAVGEAIHRYKAGEAPFRGPRRR